MKAHEDLMAELDKTGTHLKYFSQKQDVVLVKNLLASAQHRWEKLTMQIAERARHLDRADHEAKQFRDAWSTLDGWLDASDRSLEAELSVQISTVDPDSIRQQIARHKEFQRSLGAKQSSLDNIYRAGRTLKERCSKDDVQEIQDLLSKLKTKWNNLCLKSVDRYA